jgi:hypothetical protein
MLHRNVLCLALAAAQNMIALPKIQLAQAGTHLWQTIRCASIPILLASVLASAWAPVYGQGIIDPAALARRQSNLTYAQTFETPQPMITSREDGLSGKAANLEGARSGVRVPQEGVINKPAGTISWWGRLDAESIKGTTLLTIGPNYINYFGREGSSDVRHSHKVGHDYNILGGGRNSPGLSSFVYYPDGGLKPGDWHYFAFTWNGVQTQFYVDGIPAASQVLNKPFSELPPYEFVELGQPGAMSIDEVRVYNGELTREELVGFAASVKLGGPPKIMALKVPEQLAGADQPALSAIYRLSDNSVQVYAGLPGLGKEPMDVMATVRAPDGTVVSQTTYPKVSLATMFQASLKVEKPLADGVYSVVLAAAGREFKTTFERHHEVWEGNKLGVTDGPVPPWTPLVIKKKTISTWGRDYTFGSLGLPAKIRSTQPEPTLGEVTVNLLARPAELVVETTSNGTLTWKPGKPIITARGTGYADIAADSETKDGSLAASVRGTLEFDGLYKFTVKLEPKREIGVESVRLEIAIPDKLASLFNASSEAMRGRKAFLDLSGAGDGRLWDSIRSVTVKGDDGKPRLVDKDPSLPIWPHLWLGNDDRGLDVMVPSYRTWQLDEARPCMELVRRNGETVLQIFFVNRPGVLQPLEATLSLQATPVRPRPVGGTWKAVEWYGWGHFDEAVIYDKCFDAYAQGKLPEKNGPWYRTPKAKEENRWWKYGCLQAHRISKVDPIFGEMIQRTADEWGYGLHVPSYNDFLMWAYQEWMTKAKMSGVYFDNTQPVPDATFGSGLGWRDATGKMQADYSLFGMREFLKRLRAMLLADGRPAPVLMTHITDAPMVGYLGMADFWLDGENGGYLTAEQEERVAKGEATYDFVDRWYSPIGLLNLRITLGRQWGPIPMYFFSWGPDATHAVLGMFDLEKDFRPMGRTPYHDFGIREADVAFIPYWAVKPVAKVVEGGPDVLVTAWKRPGQARLLISNLSPDERTIGVDVDLAALGLPADAVVLDEREGSQLPSKNGRISNLKIPRHNYTTLIVAKPGLHTPLASGLGQALLPAADKRIKDLSDDFTTLRADWEKKTSPDFDKVTIRSGDSHGVPAVPFVSEAGVLRVRTSSGLVARLQRPFGQDNVSVQVKLREPFGGYQPGFTPGLHLDWKDGRTISITGWNKPGDNLVCSGDANGAVVFQASGPKMELITWVKIALRPDTIEFYASTDGQSWKLVHSQPRKGFEGAPDILALGHGHEKDGLPESYIFDSFFSDLGTAKL